MKKCPQVRIKKKKNLSNYIYCKYVQFIVCQLYFNKAVFKKVSCVLANIVIGGGVMCLSKFPVPGALEAWLYLALLSLRCRYRYSVHFTQKKWKLDAEK